MSPVSNRSASTIDAGGNRGQFSLVLGCFFLSGWAGLVYQTVWMRQFAVVFGTSELAICTVLAAYMAGLALGASVAGRLQSLIKRPVLLYGVLELVIAIGALLVPFGLMYAQQLQAKLIGGQVLLPDAGGMEQPLFYVSVAFVLLLIPTTCMGATLPLLIRHVVKDDEQIGSRVGLLYAINTFGAVTGTLSAGFLLLPQTGLFETTYFAMAANFLVFLLAVWLQRCAPVSSLLEQKYIQSQKNAKLARTEKINPFDPSSDTLGAGEWVLPVMLMSGFVSFTYEVLWSRLLGHVIGGSVYAFATMLATFLTGITLGSAIASRMAQRPGTAKWGLVICQLGTALASIAVYQSLEQIPAMGTALGAGVADGSALFANVLMCGAVLLPSTIFMGATYPFAVRILSGSADEAGVASARVYSWNTVGSVCGALFAGFWLVPALGFTGTIWVCVAAGLVLACLSMFFVSNVSFLWKAALPLACVVPLSLFSPQRPDGILSMSPLIDKELAGETIFHSVGRSSTVQMEDRNGFYLIKNNGLPEAIIGRKGTPPFGGELHRWLSALPIVARPEAESMLVIGFGGGTAVDDVPNTIRSIDVIELEPEVIEANRQIANLRDHDPLSDKRVRVVINDARGALSLSSKQYDIIVSQPSHPWTAGASHLYTQEFLRLAKDHLTEDGIMLQWLNTDFLDEALFKTTGATLLSEFEHVRLYQPNPTSLFFLASNQPISPEHEFLATGEPVRSNYRQYSRLPITSVNDLLATLTLDEQGLRTLCEGAPVNTDNRNRLAFSSSPNRGIAHRDAVQALIQSQDPLLDRSSSVYSDPLIAKAIDPGMIVRRLVSKDVVNRANAYADSFRIPSEKAYLKAMIARATGLTDASIQLCEQALEFDPKSKESMFLICQQSLPELRPLRQRASISNGLNLTESENKAQSASGIVAWAYRHLDPQSRAVIDSQLAIQDNDFAAVAKLEPVLARIPSDSLLHIYALQSRAAWRAAPRNSPDAWEHGKQSMEMIDQAMAISPRPEAFSIRMNAAMKADNPDAVLETARQFARILQESSNPSPEILQQLDQIKLIVDRTGNDPRMNGAVVQQVSRFVNEAVSNMKPETAPTTQKPAILPASHTTE